LSESSIAGGVGFWGTFVVSGRWDVALFGEAQSRVVVSLDPSDIGLFRDLAKEYMLPWVELGVVGGSGFSLGDLIDIPLVNLQHAWESGLEENLA
jgi:phosphoribosylformylglycinamidine synthase